MNLIPTSPRGTFLTQSPFSDRFAPNRLLIGQTRVPSLGIAL